MFISPHYPDFPRVSTSWDSQQQKGPSVTGPEEITLKEWEKHLDVLPPLAWVIEPGTESFRVHEPDYADIHLTLVRVGRKFYKMHCPLGESHEQLLGQVTSYIANRPRSRRRRGS